MSRNCAGLKPSYNLLPVVSRIVLLTPWQHQSARLKTNCNAPSQQYGKYSSTMCCLAFQFGLVSDAWYQYVQGTSTRAMFNFCELNLELMRSFANLRVKALQAA